jgi:hypothetical protein
MDSTSNVIDLKAYRLASQKIYPEVNWLDPDVRAFHSMRDEVAALEGRPYEPCDKVEAALREVWARGTYECEMERMQSLLARSHAR